MGSADPRQGGRVCGSHLSANDERGCRCVSRTLCFGGRSRPPGSLATTLRESITPEMGARDDRINGTGLTPHRSPARAFVRRSQSASLSENRLGLPTPLNQIPACTAKSMKAEIPDDSAACREQIWHEATL